MSQNYDEIKNLLIEINERINKMNERINKMSGEMIEMRGEMNGMRGEMKEMNRKIDTLSAIASFDHPVYWTDTVSERYFANILNEKILKNQDDIRVCFCNFLKELEQTTWEKDTFIDNLSDNFKRTCAVIFNFPFDHKFYVRNCYDELFNKSSKNGIYLLSGSPGTGKTTFIIHHMKKAISLCRERKVSLVCNVNCCTMYYFY
jgi:hypothetical protein